MRKKNPAVARLEAFQAEQACYACGGGAELLPVLSLDDVRTIMEAPRTVVESPDDEFRLFFFQDVSLVHAYRLAITVRRNLVANFLITSEQKDTVLAVLRGLADGIAVVPPYLNRNPSGSLEISPNGFVASELDAPALI